ncbi:MAG: M1 family aminopeptidase [Terriglobales bacterium]
MTKVVARTRRGCRLVAALLAMFVPAFGQNVAHHAGPPEIQVGGTPVAHSAAENLFLELGNAGLDSSRVYRARELSIDRAAFHISFEDGVIGFSQDVAGCVTGAFFEGEGEILLTPPNQVERASMTLQTGAAILEERFNNAYFRFNDDTFVEMQPYLVPAENSTDFVSRWNQTARNLAEPDALRLFMTFSQLSPVTGTAQKTSQPCGNPNDRFLHARLQGQTKGTFDVFYDSGAPEQVWAGQSKAFEGVTYYNVWTSYSLLKKNPDQQNANSIATEEGRASAIDILSNKIRVEIKPPTTIDAVAVLDLKVRQGGQQAIVFELARLLHIKEVLADGRPVDFIHNPAIEGTQLARHENDLVAVVFPAPLQTGQTIELRFTYGGEVLSEAAAGLLYVGARGTWYPNRGIAMSNFDLEFHYPPGWTLVATGQRVDAVANPGTAPVETTPPVEQVSRWVSERPIPVAGFDLGKYQRVEARAGDVVVEAYATKMVERGFPQGETEVVIPGPSPITTGPALAITASPSPARNEQMVANLSARAIESYSRWFGPYPFHRLALTQFPGNMSQGWPGLIFLSSLSYLSNEEKSHLHLSSADKTLIGVVIRHETAHQWWGDLVTWNDYRDQWIPEALANYSALMLVEAEDSTKFYEVLGKYRNDLFFKNPADVRLLEDGPVTLGTRLSCSQFPNGYDAISYGRGTWLFHMLRYMMRDAEPTDAAGNPETVRDEPFVRALRKVRQRFEGKPITTRELLHVFEEELPRPLWYEGRRSLDWFYDGWVNGTAVPRFEIHGMKYVDTPKATTVTGTILQKDAPDDLVTLVPLYAFRGGKMTLLGQVFADGPETPFHLTAPFGTRKILIDPKQTLLARE